MHQKMSDRSQVFSLVKLGECLLKYSSLVSLTRMVSQLNTSECLCVSTLCKGSISHHFELGGPSGVALDMVLLRGMMSTRSREGVTTWVGVNTQVLEKKGQLEQMLAQ